MEEEKGKEDEDEERMEEEEEEECTTNELYGTPFIEHPCSHFGPEEAKVQPMV